MDADLGGLLANSGPVGLVAAIALTGAWKVWQREVDRADRLENENRDIRSRVEEKFLPALVEASSQLTEVAKVLEEHRRERVIQDRLSNRSKRDNP